MACGELGRGGKETRKNTASPVLGCLNWLPEATEDRGAVPFQAEANGKGSVPLQAQENVRGTMVHSLNTFGFWFLPDKPRVRKGLGAVEHGKRIYITKPGNLLRVAETMKHLALSPNQKPGVGSSEELFNLLRGVHVAWASPTLPFCHFQPNTPSSLGMFSHGGKVVLGITEVSGLFTFPVFVSST